MLWHDRKRPVFGLPLSFTIYELDEERLYVKTGFLNQTENEVRLYRILDLQLNRSLWQRLFGVGSITISSSDKSLGNFVIKDVKHPREVKEQISNLVEQQRDAKRVVSREYMETEEESEDENS